MNCKEFNRKNLGKAIKHVREFRNCTQTMLSKGAGKESAAYIAFIETGERNVNAVDLYKIASFLKVPVGYLYGEVKDFDESLKFKMTLS